MKKLFKSLNKVHLTLILVFIIVLSRMISLAISPLEMSADEAQYWLWSNQLSWGYFSKPPIIAWTISLTNTILGVSDFSVRASSPIIHGFTSLVIFQLTKNIFTKSNYIPFLSSLIWLTFPIVGVGSFLISTDTPLMLIWSLGLLTIHNAIKMGTSSAWMLAGFTSGIGMLAKYAALYMPLGVLLLFIFIPNHKIKNKIYNFILYLSCFFLIASPNLIWNIQNSFSTINHLTDNAVLNEPSFSIEGSFLFLISQIGVVGPVLFLISIYSLWGFWKDNNDYDWIGWFVLPVLIIMVLQGFISETNANWSATALPGLTVFLACFLSKHKLISIISISSNSLICLIILIISISGSLGFWHPNSDPLRKLRGWEKLSIEIKERIRFKDTEIVLTERRGVIAPLLYYLRNEKINLRILKASAKPINHYEKIFSISEEERKKFIFISEIKELPDTFKNNYLVLEESLHSVNVAKNKNRVFYFYYIEKQ